MTPTLSVRRLAVSIAAVAAAGLAAAGFVASQPHPMTKADDPFACAAYGDWGVCIYPPIKYGHSLPA